MRKLMLSAICLLFALAGKAEGVSSPSGQVKLDFGLSKNGAPTYQVEYKGKSVIKPSTLGLELKNTNNLLDGFEVLKASTSTFTKPVNRCGERRKIFVITTTNCWLN